MKKLLITLLLLVSAIGYSQSRDFYIATTQGLDAPNLIRGGSTLPSGEKRNGAALAYRGELLVHANGIEWGPTAEFFPTIDYYAFGLRVGTPIMVAEDIELPFLDYFDLGDFVIAPAVEVMIVDRSGLDNTNIPGNREEEAYFNHAWRLSLRLEEIGGSPFGLQIEPALVWRGDKIGIWGPEALPGSYTTQLWDGRGLYLSVFINLTKLFQK